MARSLEEAGFSTIVLTPTPEFQDEVGMPRVVAVAYPFGRVLGQVGDAAGQHEVLEAVLQALEQAKTPGSVTHLAFTWPEAPKEVKWHPPEISPIVKLHLEQIKKAAAQGRKSNPE